MNESAPIVARQWGIGFVLVKKPVVADLGLLRAEPGQYVAAQAAGRASPAQILQYFAFLARPPIFLDHHQRPAAATGARERCDLDDKAVPWAHDAMPLALEFDAVMDPVRALQRRIGEADQQVEGAKERRVGQALHSACSRAERLHGFKVDKLGTARPMFGSHRTAIPRQESSALWALSGDSIPRVI